MEFLVMRKTEPWSIRESGFAWPVYLGSCALLPNEWPAAPAPLFERVARKAE